MRDENADPHSGSMPLRRPCLSATRALLRPAVARDLISPDLAPVQGSLITALPINILPLQVLSWLAGHSRGLDVGRSRSRADCLGDCPDETDELTGHRRNGYVLELAPPEQRSVTLIEAG